eukprot:TRINITY_DN2381_c3_g1_i1.p1 TRINITY_DN2381_c3_g1~~TRINITY_DN2381_c3_g1_i1.p1  ORF type:complete len:978 (-),score=182.53 TRINITY_DN2381_c3_g1_i1:651-3584(-)
MSDIISNRVASVVVGTAAAYLWQLQIESKRGTSSPDMQLQASVLDWVSSAVEWMTVGFSFTYDRCWPPSQKSAPFLGFAVICFAVYIQQSFFNRQETAEGIRVRSTKKRLLLAQMTQALRWNEHDKPDLEEEEAEPQQTTEKKSGGEDQEKKRPPSALDLFKMIYDEIEDRHATEFGIAKDQEPYISCVALFKERLVADLKDAVAFTNLARQHAAGDACSGELDGEDLKRMAEYLDGTKLTELLDVYDRKIRKAFGCKVVPRIEEYVKAAKECRQSLASEQRKGVRLLYPIVRPVLPTYAVAILLMAFDSMIGCVTHNSIHSLLDGVGAGTMTMEELKWITLQAYITLVFCIFAHLGSWALVGKCTSQFRCKLRSEIMKNMVCQDMRFFDIFPSGILQERLNGDAESLASKMFRLPNRICHHFFLTLSVASMLYRLCSTLFMTVCIPIPLVSCACYFIVRCMRKLDERQRKVGEHLAANTMEVLKEIRTVREFAMEGEEADNFAANSAYRAEVEEYASALHHIALISPLVCLFEGVRFACTFLAGSYVASGFLTVGQAIQVGSLANDLQHIVQDFFHVFPEVIAIFQPLGRVCDILTMKPSIEPHSGSLEKLKPERFSGAIEFKNVNFTFPSEPQKQILFNLSFSVSPGQKVGFVGATGSGKSTSIKLIERFYNPQSGIITLDGKPIGDYDVHHLRRHMSVVAQDNTLFSTTIRENIIYGLPRERRDNITDSEIEDACRKANAWCFVNDFPRKLETYAGERGVKLSGGQKQRLAIARAIIRRPTIILLDEATSALDSKAEVVVKTALDQMISENASGCTIIIAHRLTTVKSCDQILVMDKGSVKESGRHEELLKIPLQKGSGGEVLSGWYRDLWETQHGKCKDDSSPVRLSELEAENKKLKEDVCRLRAALTANLKRGIPKRNMMDPFRDCPMPLALVRTFSNPTASAIQAGNKVDEEDDVPSQLPLNKASTTPIGW